jgi:hypothetical protein
MTSHQHTAFEINGQVVDATGHVVYETACRWDGHLVAQEVGMGLGGSPLPPAEMCNLPGLLPYRTAALPAETNRFPGRPATVNCLSGLSTASSFKLAPVSMYSGN